jgi:23S rRNA (cytidine1920-2'-O)/16S rRNA (cytidine1409-2'-O)-methyltransferase
VSKDKKIRLDKLLVEKGWAPSQEKARALIYAGVVHIGPNRSVKPGKAVDPATPVTVTEAPYPFVSRGGVKLQKALEVFGVEVKDKIALDIGASTGGFTHCLLLHGAARVYAVDVGYGQLAWEIRQDPRVKVLERVNARYLTKEQIGETVDLAVVDTSFISLKLIVPPLLPILREEGEIIVLVKPQFEVGKEKVGKGGVVRNEEDRRQVLTQLGRVFRSMGLKTLNLTDSPILGAKGNREYFMHLKKG